jgi:hypothetical protein
MVPQRESQKFRPGGKIQPVGGLLKSQERVILVEIAGLEIPHSQRASVLLALDSGATQVEAGKRAGMSPRQARYWRDRFVQHRLNIFPQDLLSRVRIQAPSDTHALITKQEDKSMESAQEESEQVADQSQELENQPEELQLTATDVEENEQVEIDKKAKKAKGKKKKKDNKDKKSKKDKKKKSSKKAGAKKKSAKNKKKRRKK